MSKTITVFGGSGFLGRRICEAGIKHGYKVNAVSRSGKGNLKDKWTEQVNWVQGNCFNPEALEETLSNSWAVVHSLGILFENNQYKHVVNGSIADAAGNAFKASTAPSPTYEAVNWKSAVNLAKTFASFGGKKFAYISAQSPGPIASPILGRYIASKRAAEHDLMELDIEIDVFVVRPGFLYDKNSDNSVRSCLHGLIQGARMIPGMSKLIVSADSTQQVAESVIKGLEMDGRRVVGEEFIANS